MFWTHEATRTPAGEYFIQSKQWEMNEEGGYDLSDVDEPAVSEGMTFHSLSQLRDFAVANRIRIDNVKVL